MRSLYIDTSSSFLYAGIIEEEKILAECQKRFDHDLSKEALPEIIKLFEKSKLDPQDIDKIIVVNGPGSFTGIRIGITIAKVYAWTLNIPITTITSLEAMAISAEEKKVHIPMIDARRGYVFAGIYDEENRCLFTPKHIKLETILKEVEKFSNYAIITNDEIEKISCQRSYQPNILKIVNYFQNKESISPHSVNPDYLKLTEAEEKKN